MKIIKLTNSQEIIQLTIDELERFNEIKEKFRNSINPGEAAYYKNELDSLVTLGRQRK